MFADGWLNLMAAGGFRANKQYILKEPHPTWFAEIISKSPIATHVKK